MVDNPGKSQLVPAMMVIVLFDLTNKVLCTTVTHAHVHVYCMTGVQDSMAAGRDYEK